jgi:hypothetical protein
LREELRRLARGGQVGSTPLAAVAEETPRSCAALAAPSAAPAGRQEMEEEEDPIIALYLA